MLEYTGSPETVHFVNWALHSGHVDPFVLADKAVAAVDIKGEYAAEEMRDELAGLLAEALADWAGEFAPGFPDFCEDTMEAMAHAYAEEADYRGTDALCLFAPLLLSAIEQIDFWQAADRIFACIRRVSRRSAAAPALNSPHELGGHSGSRPTAQRGTKRLRAKRRG